MTRRQAGQRPGRRRAGRCRAGRGLAGRGRGGKTLIEMLVIITLLAALLAPSLAVIRTLLQTQRSAEALLVISRTVGELGRQWARDAHGARSVTTGAGAAGGRDVGGQVTRVELVSAEEVVTAWDWSSGELVRTVGGKQRREFAFTAGTRFAVRVEAGRLVELLVEVPAERRQVNGAVVAGSGAEGLPANLPVVPYRFVGRMEGEGKGKREKGKGEESDGA
jgi:Flp pilus assembly protein TadG